MHHRRRLVFVRHIAAALAATVACDRGSPRVEAAATGSERAAPAADVGPGAPLRDDFGDTLPAGAHFRRIVSLNPATTELFFALGAGDRLVGRTHYDAYPPAALAVPDLGDGMRPNVEAVLGARPDLVVLYASGDNRDAAARLRGARVATLSLRVNHIADFTRTARVLGRVLGDTLTAHTVVDSVERTLARVRAATARLPRRTAFWKAWDDPIMAIGGGSFLAELVDIAGGRNIYGDDPRPAFNVTIEDVIRRDPDVVLAGPESGARMRAAPAWQALRAVREGRVLVVDTTLVGRPGVRLGEAAVSLARLLHPGALP